MYRLNKGQSGLSRYETHQAVANIVLFEMDVWYALIFSDVEELLWTVYFYFASENLGHIILSYYSNTTLM